MGKYCGCDDRIKLSKILVRLHVIKKKGHITMKYDFDYLKNLYIEDPDEFEKITSAMINDAIDNMPEENREIYRAKQWRLEQTLNKINDPLERMNRMVAIFWEGVNEFVEVTRNCVSIASSSDEEPKIGEVLDFKKKPKD